MMNREGFEQQVDNFFHQRPCENAISAKSALMALYDYILNRARIALAQEEGSPIWGEMLFKIQQTMTWTPLRLFWYTLAEDELLPIRAAAKGNITETDLDSGYWNDPEIGIMGRVNLPIMLSSRVIRFQKEVAADPLIQQAIAEWVVSTQGMGFTPQLKITVLGPPAKP